MNFGEFFKQKRKEKKMTLRKFCLEYDLDPGNISKLERGKLSPPSSKRKLKEYAQYLDIKPESSEWRKFCDLAAISAGKIPEYIDDEEILARLPLFFRTLKNKKVSKEDLEALIEKIRNS